jgi:DNA-binding PadR family transcriptional regulator
MLILKTVNRGPNHGYGIAQQIRLISGDALKIGEGSLYPALQRLLIDDYLEAEWGVSEKVQGLSLVLLMSGSLVDACVSLRRCCP